MENTPLTPKEKRCSLIAKLGLFYGFTVVLITLAMKYGLLSFKTVDQDTLNISITLGVHFAFTLFPAIAIFRTEGKFKGLLKLYILCLASLFAAYLTSPFNVTIMAVALSCMIWIPIIIITTVFRGVDCSNMQRQKESS